MSARGRPAVSVFNPGMKMLQEKDEIEGERFILRSGERHGGCVRDYS